MQFGGHLYSATGEANMSMLLGQTHFFKENGEIYIFIESCVRFKCNLPITIILLIWNA